MRLFVDLLDYLELQSIPVRQESTGPVNVYFGPMRRSVVA
jgi:hypothetical protein